MKYTNRNSAIKNSQDQGLIEINFFVRKKKGFQKKINYLFNFTVYKRRWSWLI